MEISQDDLSAMLAKAATDAVEATYAAIAAREAEKAAEAEKAMAAAADAAEATKAAEGRAWAGDLFGALAVAIAAADRLEREAHETRPVRMAMLDAAGNYLGFKEGPANLMQGADVSALPEWARPPAITYVEWTDAHDDLHRDSLNAAVVALEAARGRGWAFKLFGALSAAITAAELLDPSALPSGAP